MNLLALTTSTSHHGIWLQQPGQAGVGIDVEVGRGGARNLTELIWRLLAEQGLQPCELDLVACDVGPGSFTGLRLGLATARALAWGLGLPVVGIGSLEAMVADAWAARAADAVVAALPARRGVSFVAWSPAPGQVSEAVVADADAAAWAHAQAGQGPRVVGLVGAPLGAGTALHVALCEAFGAAQVVDLALPPHPSAERIALLAVAAPADARSAALRLQPRYLAVSEAEVAAGYAVPEIALTAERG